MTILPPSSASNRDGDDREGRRAPTLHNLRKREPPMAIYRFRSNSCLWTGRDQGPYRGVRRGGGLPRGLFS
jgi:hypothetical protein